MSKIHTLSLACIYVSRKKAEVNFVASSANSSVSSNDCGIKAHICHINLKNKYNSKAYTIIIF